jgi:transcriptional regulator with XRE-family HTH domain
VNEFVVHPGRGFRRDRRAIDVSQREMARAIGKSASWLCNFEKGRFHPSDEMMERMRAVLRAFKATRPAP